jgi:hypothetical protein
MICAFSLGFSGKFFWTQAVMSANGKFGLVAFGDHVDAGGLLEQLEEHSSGRHRPRSD